MPQEKFTQLLDIVQNRLEQFAGSLARANCKMEELFCRAVTCSAAGPDRCEPGVGLDRSPVVTPVSCDFAGPFTRQCEKEAPPGTVDPHMLTVGQLNSSPCADTSVSHPTEHDVSGDPRLKATVAPFPAVRHAVAAEQPSEETSMSDAAPGRPIVSDQLQ